MKEAAIAVIFRNDQLLLIKRRDVPVWVFPGGGIDEGETPEQAVLREVWEETGLRVQIVRKIAEYTPINHLAKKTYLFECRELDGCLRTGCETADINYFPLHDLPALFFIVHRDWLQDALEKSDEVITKPITRVTYFEFAKYFSKHPWQVITFFSKKFVR